MSVRCYWYVTISTVSSNYYSPIVVTGRKQKNDSKNSKTILFVDYSDDRARCEHRIITQSLPKTTIIKIFVQKCAKLSS